MTRMDNDTLPNLSLRYKTRYKIQVNHSKKASRNRFETNLWRAEEEEECLDAEKFRLKNRN